MRFTQGARTRRERMIHFTRSLTGLCTALLSTASVSATPGNDNFFQRRYNGDNQQQSGPYGRISWGERQKRYPQHPTRQCGQVVGVTSIEDILNALSDVTDVVLPADGSGATPASYNPLAKQLSQQTVIYNVEARVLCGSCQELLEANAVMLNADYDGFLTYCGPDRYGYDVVYSGLLLTPMDPLTNETVTGKIKGAMYFHDTIASTSAAPSEAWPESLADMRLSFADPAEFATTLGELSTGMAVAASGAVVIMPDYIGFGQSYRSERSFLVKSLYQQAAVTLWFSAKKNVFRNCTILDNQVSTAGYYEGGYAAFAGARALHHQNVEVLTAQVGAAPFRVSQQLQLAIQQYDRGVAQSKQSIYIAALGNAYSSTNLDLPNTDKDQDLLSSNWTIATNYSTDVKQWIADELTLDELIARIPSPYAPQILWQQVVSFMQAASISGVSDPCSSVNSSNISLLCQALRDNDLYDDLAGTTFPVILCHSPDDTVVTIDSIPDTTVNAFLSLFTVFGIKATGDHEFAGNMCRTGFAALFSVFNTDDSLNKIDPLDNSNSCPSVAAPTSAPVALKPGYDSTLESSGTRVTLAYGVVGSLWLAWAIQFTLMFQ